VEPSIKGKLHSGPFDLLVQRKLLNSRKVVWIRSGREASRKQRSFCMRVAASRDLPLDERLTSKQGLPLFSPFSAKERRPRPRLLARARPSLFAPPFRQSLKVWVRGRPSSRGQFRTLKQTRANALLRIKREFCGSMLIRGGSRLLQGVITQPLRLSDICNIFPR
jgi:hypothetical protein